MRRTNGIIAIFLHYPDLSCIRFFVTAGTKDSIVVMNAGTSKYDALSIDKEALLLWKLDRNNFV